MKGEHVVAEKIRDVVQQFERKEGRRLVQRHGVTGVDRRPRKPREVDEIRALLPIEVKDVLTEIDPFPSAFLLDTELNTSRGGDCDAETTRVGPTLRA